MRLLTSTAATAAVLTLAFPQSVLAQDDADDGAVGQPLQLSVRPSDNRGQISGRSEGAKPSTGTGSSSIDETTIRGRSHTRHRFASRAQPGHANRLDAPFGGF